MIQVNEIKLPAYSCSMEDIKAKLAKELSLPAQSITHIEILKKSLDARKKPDLYYIFSLAVDITCKKEIYRKLLSKRNISEYHKVIYKTNYNLLELPNRPIVIGAGPAGLFASYLLALQGLNPLLLERGKSITERTCDVEAFWNTGLLLPESNVQFGEGGAGAFSDGKLNTLVKDKFGRNRFVLETFVKFGANSNILYENKPHVGTDVLLDVVSNLRNEILRLGGEVRFSSQVTDFIIQDQKLTSLEVNHKDIIACSDVILAIGHSARDTFYKLHECKIPMLAKEFAVGLRIEHPQEFIDRTQYGSIDYSLPPSPYKLAEKTRSGRGVYSFCMCPGGYVVNASSEEGLLAVNGMSYSTRASANSNSAIVVSVGNGEYNLNQPLSAIEFQRNLERKAYELGQGRIPQQLYSDFKMRRISTSYGAFSSECKGQASFSNLHELFSEEIYHTFLEGMDKFNLRIPGFAMDDAILSGVESRTSSPVRICRNDDFMSDIVGLYPCGEGAGYAGGIMSAAMDGLKCAEKLMEKYLV